MDDSAVQVPNVRALRPVTGDDDDDDAGERAALAGMPAGRALDCAAELGMADELDWLGLGDADPA